LKHKMKHEKSKQTFINFLIDFSKNWEWNMFEKYN
jgi:hypothetical protein